MQPSKTQNTQKYLYDGIIINMCTINDSQCVLYVEFYLR